MLDHIDEQLRTGHKLRAICRSLPIPIQPNQYRRWKKIESDIRNKKNAKKMSNSTGRTSILKPHENDLMMFFFATWSQGFAVSVRMMILHASKICLRFRRNS